MYAHAKTMHPGDVLGIRRPYNFIKGETPIFFKSGKGSKVIDVDGNNTYFAEGVLVHNKGSESRPVADAAHTFTENPGVGGTAI